MQNFKQLTEPQKYNLLQFYYHVRGVARGQLANDYKWYADILDKNDISMYVQNKVFALAKDNDFSDIRAKNYFDDMLKIILKKEGAR